MKTLHEQAENIYFKHVQGGVLKWANFQQGIDWKMCEPCESLSPIADNACLVCGSTIK